MFEVFKHFNVKLAFTFDEIFRCPTLMISGHWINPAFAGLHVQYAVRSLTATM